MNEEYFNQKLSEICEMSIMDKYPEDRRDDARARLKKELQLINRHHYSGQYLGYRELIRHNDLHPSQYGVRGCAPGSIVCFLLDITKCDPLDAQVPLYYEFYMGWDGGEKPILHFNVDEEAEIIFPDFKGEFDVKLINVIPHKNCTLNRILYEQTGYYPTQEDISSADIQQLFCSTEKLGIPNGKNHHISSGFLGVPGFESLALFHMIEVLNPKNTRELAKVLGLYHGTDVWCKNGEWLVRDGMETMESILSDREDVYEMLLSYGIPKGKALRYAQMIRKGHWAKGKIDFIPDEELYDYGIPGHIVWSLERIQYLFPRAHQAEYLQMELRSMYYKWRYPELYYNLYFDLFGNEFISGYRNEQLENEAFSQCGKDVYEDSMESFNQYLVWGESMLRNQMGEW